MEAINPFLITINDLSVGKITPAGNSCLLEHINLKLMRGKTLALVGESGSGKSLTALSILQLLPNGLYYGTDSQIQLEQHAILTLSEQQMQHIRGQRIGIIFQEPMTALNPVERIGKQISEVMRLQLHMSKKEAKAETYQLLQAVEIANPKDCYERFPHQLSGGMKQRVMIAMALAARPDIVIADEPTTAVDVRIQRQILQLLKNLQEQCQLTLLFITHDLSVVANIADEVAVMYAGKIIEQAPVAEFMRQAQHPYSKQLFAALPNYQKRGQLLPVPFTKENNVAPASINGKEELHTSAPLLSSSTEPLLRLKNVKVYIPTYGGILQRQTGAVKAVDGVSFHLQAGETFALVGESGCGKTTLAKALIGLLSITEGSLYYQQQPLTAQHDRQAFMQMIFQDPYSSLNPRMLIADILVEGLRARGEKISNAVAYKPSLTMLNDVGLPSSALTRYPHEFSGGQRQRIAIARALMLSPKILICDEPTSALDMLVQAQVLNLLQELQQAYGLSYLFITHNLSVVAYLANRVAVMQAGKIVEQGAVAQVLFQPQHPYTQALLSAELPQPH